LRRITRNPLGRRRARANAVAVAAGLATLAGATIEARRQRVLDGEEEVFRTVNDLPDGAHLPVWAVMQSGSFAAVGVVAGGALLARRPKLAVGLGAAGTAAWGAAKLIKRRTGRGRPEAHVEDVNVRGRPQTGLGFPSGHSAVAVALATVLAPALPAPLRWTPWTTATVTAGARMYVGAHLPLDVVGGIGLGAALGGATNLVLGGPGDSQRRPSPR
jgi:membrane-associated phospholipid phosphatase